MIIIIINNITKHMIIYKWSYKILDEKSDEKLDSLSASLREREMAQEATMNPERLSSFYHQISTFNWHSSSWQTFFHYGITSNYWLIQ
jgi:hypothetical protein